MWQQDRARPLVAGIGLYFTNKIIVSATTASLVCLHKLLILIRICRRVCMSQQGRLTGLISVSSSNKIDYSTYIAHAIQNVVENDVKHPQP